MCETAYEPGQENRTPSHGINSPVQHGQKPILSQGDNDRDKAEAEECYKLFCKLDNDLAHNNYLIIPYLFDTGQYDEIFRINLPREQLLIERQDTVNYYMASVIKTLGHAYRHIGDHRKSSLYFERLAMLRDSLKHREQESAAQEYATLYESKEKDLQLQKNNTLIYFNVPTLKIIALIHIQRY